MSPTVELNRILQGKTVSGPISARMTIDGRKYINFFGAGYLALSDIPEIRDSVVAAMQSGSPYCQQLPPAHGAIDPIFQMVEEAAAAACNTESSIYFASGYLIGAVGLASLKGSFDLLLVDESAHYSLSDAARICGQPHYAFAHCDPESLNDLLKRYSASNCRPLILTDGAFATTGRIPPLSDYAALLEKHGGRLFIDESHAFGIVGENGRGSAEHCGVEGVSSIGATLSKGICAHGAIIGCSSEIAEAMRTKPPISAANAGSPLSAVAATMSLNYSLRHPELREAVRNMATYLRTSLRSIGVTTIDSPAPIVSFRWGGHADMQAMQRRAFSRGIYIHHSNYIGAGADGMIRCAVFRDHSKDDVDALVDLLRE